MTLPIEKITPDRNNLVKLVRQWGDVNTDGILDASCQFFTTPDIEGLIGYRIESGNAVIFGDPVCATKDQSQLAQAFQQFCLEQALGIVYIIASEAFSQRTSHDPSTVLIEFGVTFTLNPCHNPINLTGSKSALLRKKLRHAAHEGITFTEYITEDKSVEIALEKISTAWQKERQGPQIFLTHPTLFNDRIGKRWFYALQSGEIIGFLILNELKRYHGWLLNNVMLNKDAANGVSELLVISTLQVLEKEGCQSVTIGPVPRKKLGEIRGLSRFSALITQGIYHLSKTFFNLGGHELFWEKFQPTRQASYLLFPNNNLSFKSIKAIMRALNAQT